MRRLTRHDYDEAGSFRRCIEGALSLADADSENDVAYHGALCRFRAAVNAYADRRAAEKARAAQQDGPGATIDPGRVYGEGGDACASPAASCGSEAAA